MRVNPNAAVPSAAPVRARQLKFAGRLPMTEGANRRAGRPAGKGLPYVPDALSRACSPLPMSPTAAQQWLQAQCDRSSEAAAALVWAAAAPAAAQAVAEWPANGPLRISLVAAAKIAVQRDQPVVLTPAVTLPSAEHSRLVAMPLKDGATVFGALALAVRVADDAAAAALLRGWEAALPALIAALRGSSGSAGGPAGLQAIDAGRILRLQALLLGSGCLAEAAGELVNELATAFRFDRVSLGIAENGQVEVIAMSHNGEVDGRHDLVRDLAAAMNEALDQSATVVHPAAAEDAPRVVLAHADLSARTGSSVCTVPMLQSGRSLGALTFERAGQPPSHRELAQYESLGALIGPLVALRRRAELPPGRRLRLWLGSAWERLRAPGDPRPKVIAAGVAGALLALALVPLPYRVGATARLEGLVQRVVAAPGEGFLSAVHVRPGDAVKAGQVLVELADRDLRLEQRKWESELAQHENTYGAALARADRSQFVIFQAKATEARAQLELVQSQLERSRLVAPIDGVVIKGDPAQSLGAPVQRGEPLLTIAPADQYRLMIDVDERDIAQVRPGQPGRLGLAALPVDTLAFRVERLTPVATVRDGRNTFEVQAVLEGPAAPLRPGLQGVAKIQVGSRSALWIATHRLTDWLRLAWWSWAG